MPAFLVNNSQKVKKIVLNYLANIAAPPTFALPKENWDFTQCLSESESNYSLTITTW